MKHVPRVLLGLGHAGREFLYRAQVDDLGYDAVVLVARNTRKKFPAVPGIQVLFEDLCEDFCVSVAQALIPARKIDVVGAAGAATTSMVAGCLAQRLAAPGRRLTFVFFTPFCWERGPTLERTATLFQLMHRRPGLQVSVVDTRACEGCAPRQESLDHTIDRVVEIARDHIQQRTCPMQGLRSG